MKLNISKVGFVYVVFVLMGIVAVIRMLDLQFIHRPDGSDLIARTAKEREIPCTRGSIIASDGRYLAFSIPEYRLSMDCTQAPDTLFDAHVDALADSLAMIYGDRKAAEYKRLLVSHREARKQYVTLNKKLLTFQQMKRAEGFPIFDKGRRGGGLIVEKFDRRQYPYDKLAFRTLGHIKDNEPQPVGIEGSCDSILRGKPGIQPIRKTEHNNWIEDTESKRIEPVDGTDVQVTIDIDIQDMAERALRHQLAKSQELEAGTVVVMEVATGEIKAMVNMRKDEHGRFGEEYNYAIGKKGEPGSVFKLATLTMLLDEGKIGLDDEIKAVVHWQYGKGKPFEDTYLRNYDKISVIRGFEISSNNVFRMLAARFYGNDPAYFVDHLNNQLMISRNYKFDIAGMAKANIKHPKDGRYWAMADLPQIAMGYTCELTPLHTLTYYNAVANNGVMVQPRLVRNYQKDGAIVKEFPVINLGRVCKEETVPKLHRAMRGVVLNGTGRNIFKDCKVEVAGKTGTARVVRPNGNYIGADGKKQHQATFAGFFPYENPKYSVIAVIYSAPTHNNFYGATWAGPVVREIAEEIYANSPDWSAPITASGKLPEFKEYAAAKAGDGVNCVPDVTGMGLRDALVFLEKSGYEVTWEGHGAISSQIPEPGTVSEEKKIKLTLKEPERKKKDKDEQKSESAS
jgi:cell division protein FtsI (penicillin-binding protein 3)